MILTTPVPFFDRISGLIGHTDQSLHVRRFTLHELDLLCRRAGLGTLRAEKFMMSPVGFVLEESIEPIMRRAGLGFLMMNQLLVAAKVS